MDSREKYRIIEGSIVFRAKWRLDGSMPDALSGTLTGSPLHYRTVDPVVAGSSPVVLDGVKPYKTTLCGVLKVFKFG